MYKLCNLVHDLCSELLENTEFFTHNLALLEERNLVELCLIKYLQLEFPKLRFLETEDPNKLVFSDLVRQSAVCLVMDAILSFRLKFQACFSRVLVERQIHGSFITQLQKLTLIMPQPECCYFFHKLHSCLGPCSVPTDAANLMVFKMLCHLLDNEATIIDDPPESRKNLYSLMKWRISNNGEGSIHILEPECSMSGILDEKGYFLLEKKLPVFKQFQPLKCEGDVCLFILRSIDPNEQMQIQPCQDYVLYSPTMDSAYFDSFGELEQFFTPGSAIQQHVGAYICCYKKVIRVPTPEPEPQVQIKRKKKKKSLVPKCYQVSQTTLKKMEPTKIWK